MGLCCTIILCLVLKAAHMWILGDPGAALLRIWSCHLLFISFGKYCCIERDAETAVPKRRTHPPSLIPSQAFCSWICCFLLCQTSAPRDAEFTVPLNGRRNSYFQGSNHPRSFYDGLGIEDAVSTCWTRDTDFR